MHINPLTAETRHDSQTGFFVRLGFVLPTISVTVSTPDRSDISSTTVHLSDLVKLYHPDRTHA